MRVMLNQEDQDHESRPTVLCSHLALVHLLHKGRNNKLHGSDCPTKGKFCNLPSTDFMVL
jgi:hypothetical protein